MKQKKTLKKISDIEYNGPKKTFTEELTQNEIIELLEGYIETDYTLLKKGFHVRYFSINKKTRKQEFKMGGTILKLTLPDYIVLSNGYVNWSVQIDGTTFFQQMTMSEIKTALQVELSADLHVKDLEITNLKAKIKILEKESLDKNKEIELLNKKILKMSKNK